MKSQSNVNCDFFINCNTPESAYLLGFLWGDGYLYKREYVEKRIGKKKIGFYNKKAYHIKTECSDEDLSSLIYLFNFSGKWTQSRRHRPSRKPQLCLSTCNKKLYDFMDKYNYNIKSGGHPIILDIISDNLKHYWWRGYFDADGCIYKIKNRNSIQISITSTYDQDWTATSDLLDKLGAKYSITKVIRKNSNKYSYIRFTSKKSTKAFLDYIYTGKEFGLLRKKDIYSKLYVSNSASPTILIPSTTP